MRPARALIDLQALRHNYQLAREVTGPKPSPWSRRMPMAMVPYVWPRRWKPRRMGLRWRASRRHWSCGLPGFVRRYCCWKVFEADELPLIIEHDFWCVVHSLWQLEAIEQARLSKPLTIWLKLDSGMHRVGLHPKDYHEAYQRLLASGKVAKIVLMSHFARADELDCVRSDEQVAVFEAARQGLSAEVSLRNSPSVMGWPNMSSDWVRPGIMLYGATPFGEDQAIAARLQPVMTLESKVICVRELPAGEPIGYGAKFITPKPMRIGVVAMGYADGYPRHAPTGTPVLVAGQRSQLLGRVSMDMLCVDLTDVPQAGLGSTVELWGKNILASDVAAAAETIPYQIFCNLRRVPRLYCGA